MTGFLNTRGWRDRLLHALYGLREAVRRHLWLRRLAVPTRRQMRALLNIYAEADRKVRKFKQRSGLDCLPGCGVCCDNPRVETSVLECMPIAFSLYGTGDLDAWRERAMDVAKPGVCLFFKRERDVADRGHCKVYALRPLICRLYGFASGTDKYQKPVLVTCHALRAHFPNGVARASADLGLQRHLPSMGDLARKAAQVDPHNGVRQRPINEAFAIAFDRAGLMMKLKTERPFRRMKLLGGFFPNK